jgi:capsular polysaccharide transport system permease protein
VQVSAIAAIAIHALRVQSKKDKFGLLWEILEPLALVAGWFLLYTILTGPQKVYDLTLWIFLGTGIVGFFILTNFALHIPRFVAQQKGLLRFPVVHQIDLLVAGGIKEGFILVIVASIVWGGVIIFHLGFAPADLLGIIAAAGSLGLLGWSFGCFNSMVISLIPVYAKVLQVVIRILFFTSGAIIPVDALPPNVKQYLYWNPLLQGIEQIRSAWSYTFESVNTSNWYVLAWASAFLLLALLTDHHSLRAHSK